MIILPFEGYVKNKKYQKIYVYKYDYPQLFPCVSPLLFFLFGSCPRDLGLHLTTDLISSIATKSHVVGFIRYFCDLCTDGFLVFPEENSVGDSLQLQCLL